MNFKNKKPREARQKQLNIKYAWYGMSKSNTRKHNKRMKFVKMDNQ